MWLRYTVVVAFIENTTLGMSMAAFFKRGFRKYFKKKKFGWVYSCVFKTQPKPNPQKRSSNIKKRVYRVDL